MPSLKSLVASFDYLYYQQLHRGPYPKLNAFDFWDIVLWLIALQNIILPLERGEAIELLKRIHLNWLEWSALRISLGHTGYLTGDSTELAQIVVIHTIEDSNHCPPPFQPIHQKNIIEIQNQT